MKFFVVLALCVACAIAVPLVGLEHVGAGIDGATGKLKLPVVQMNYQQGRTWRNPLTGEDSDVCDQCYVSFASEVDLSVVTLTAGVAYGSVLAGATGVQEVDGNGVAQSGNLQAAAGFFGEETVVVVVSEAITFYTVVIADLSPNTTQLFDSLMARMPEEYAPQHYKKLITKFGTHFVNEATFGGLATLVTAVNASVEAIASGAVDVEALAVGTFNQMKSGSWLAGVAEGVQAGEVAGGSIQTVTYLTLKGGFYDNASSYSSWVDSLKQAPTVVKKQLVPIPELVSEPRKQMSLYKAVSEYMH